MIATAIKPGSSVEVEGRRGSQAFKLKLKVVERPTRQVQRQ